MAPICPEEVDVFRIPHSRMKDLVEQYLDLMTSTNFSNEGHLTKLLENLCKTFREFIAHEQIENRYIMKKLKNKLHSLSIQNNAVCNCHKDNQLTDMLSLLQDGYKCTKKSEADRKNYGIKLGQALEEFTKTFIPHMEEEEEVFQPLLMQYFSIEELKQIKAKVIEQHLKVEADETPEKCVHDNRSVKCTGKKTTTPCETVSGFDLLPDEVIMKIFHCLNPKELSQASQVSTRWQRLSLDDSLWTKLLPVSWAKGDWDADEGVYEEDSEDSVDQKLEQKIMDEDADVDESHDNDSWNDTDIFAKQSRMLVAMCKYLLPKVGKSVKHCDLAYCKGLTNGTLYKILSLCPNLEHLNLTQTHISDLGFKGLQKGSCGSKLRHVDLTGCLYITDKTLERLASATILTPEEYDIVETTNKQDPEEEQNPDNHKPDINSADIEKNFVEIVNIEHVCEEENAKSSDRQILKDQERDTKTKKCCKKTKKCCMQDNIISIETQSNENRCKIDETVINIVDTVRHENASDENVDEILNPFDEQFDETCNVSSNCSSDGFSSIDSIDNEDTADSETIVCCDDARCCDSECMGKNDLRVNAAPSSCEDALSRLRCCQQSLRTGEYLWEKDIETSMTIPKCCMRATKISCCRNGYKNAGHNPQQDHILQAYPNIQTKNETLCGNHPLQTSNRPPDTSQQTSAHDQCRPDKKYSSAYFENDPTNENSASILHDTKVEIYNVPKEDKALEDNNDSGVEAEEKESNEKHVLLETTIEISPTIEQQNQLNTEAGDSVGITLIPEIYIVPLEEIDCDKTGSGAQTVSLPECAPQTGYQPEGDMNYRGTGNQLQKGRQLEFLCLSGCYQITDDGLQCYQDDTVMTLPRGPQQHVISVVGYLAEDGGLPNLRHLDLSGCLNLTGEAVSLLVSTAGSLIPARLSYCDNILDGPYMDTASGCQNLQCSTRACCRVGE